MILCMLSIKHYEYCHLVLISLRIKNLKYIFNQKFEVYLENYVSWKHLIIQSLSIQTPNSEIKFARQKLSKRGRDSQTKRDSKERKIQMTLLTIYGV